MSTFRGPDFKQGKRKKSTAKEWQTIKAEVATECRICGKPRPELHHLIGRDLGGSDVADNLVPLCHLHHKLVEERDRMACDALREKLTWNEQQHVIANKSREFLNRYYPALLDDLSGAEAQVESADPLTGQIIEQASDGNLESAPSPGCEPLTAIGGISPRPGDTCVQCGRTVPHKREKPEGTRPKVTWAIKVPKDRQEDGHAILVTLIEETQKELGREGEPPYYALVEALHFFLTTPKERAA